MADKIGSRVWANMCHLKGTEALLQFRQQKKLSSNVALERAVRRPLVSHNVGLLTDDPRDC